MPRVTDMRGETQFPTLLHGSPAPRAYVGPQPRMRLECTPPHDFRHAQIKERINCAELVVDRQSV